LQKFEEIFEEVEGDVGVRLVGDDDDDDDDERMCFNVA